MLLRTLISNLESVPPATVFPYGFTTAHSWRGNYSEVAFTPEVNVKAKDMLEYARNVLGQTYTGWKGGEYTMHEDTEVYIAHQGFYGGLDDAMTIWRWKLMLKEAGVD